MFKSKRIQSDLILLGVAAIWGSAFVAQRVAALHLGIFLFNSLRFLLGAALLLPFAWRHFSTCRGKQILGPFVAGLFLFGGAALQQLGLRYTTAGNAGFITGLYVVLVPLILAVGWKRRPSTAVWLASLLSAAGLFLLSTGGKLTLTPGDTLISLSAFLWALMCWRLDGWRSASIF